MRRLLLRTFVLVTVTAALILVGFGNVAASTNSTATTDFYYQPQVVYTQVSTGIVAPQGVPYCLLSSGSSLLCYTPAFLKTAYNFPSTLDGTGQTILIVDAFGSPTIQNDLTVFDTALGIPAPPSFTILCGTGGCPAYSPRNTFHGETGWGIETSLDVEYAHAMAPGANIVLVVAATSSGNALNDAEATAIPLYPGSIMSQSFGIPEILVHNNNAQIMQAHQNYMLAQSEGITVFASAGDSGATNGYATANAGYPSSDPLVTAVGGTQGNPYLPEGSTFNCASGATCSSGLSTFTGPCSTGPRFTQECTPVGYGGEEVWNEPSFGAATGGSPSLLFSTPDYQSGLGLSARTTPDVSYNAAIDGGVLVFTSFLGAPIWFIVGGTSAGSPQWAAIAALADQAAGHALGFLNPKLYAIAEGSSYANDFHDITVGNNQLVGTPVGFGATTGYDAASGWGTPNVANLVADLSA